MDPASNPTVHLQNLPPGYLQSRTSSSIRVTSRGSKQVNVGEAPEKAADKDAVNQEARVHSEATSNGHCLADGGHGDGELEAGQTPPLDTYTVELDFPEGGLRAWLVVASAFSMAFASFGFMVSIGTLQDYWHMHQLSHLSSRDVGWIPSVFTYLSLALGLWVGPLFDHYGPRWIALVGSVGYLLMVFLLAECTQFWHFLLCCGVLGGTSGAALTTTPLAVVAHWFNRRRGFAQGVVMIGSSFGGPHLAPDPASHAPTVRARIPPLRHRGGAGGGKKQKPKIISLAIFGDLRFTLLTVSVFGFEVVLFSALGILPTYASLANPSYPPETTGFYLIAILNGVSCLGRLGPGWLADKVGRFNMLLAMTVFTLFWMLALWLPLGQSSLAALYAFAGLFGFGTGGWMALTPACVGQLCRADEFGRYYGTMYFVASLATLICIPVSGELVESVGPTAYVVFLCAVLAVSLVSFVFSRWACLDRRWLLVAKV
ncbi:major facilitator superfamily domain-containing protein [Apiospora kogelbergensis]|uniref:Major facilitator superfamily domain-containing protein n=1 Tax=Apiospora kogelbergensis TaxID=1337665 RepID=A0AAW0R367_9PEZI